MGGAKEGDVEREDDERDKDEEDEREDALDEITKVRQDLEELIVEAEEAGVIVPGSVVEQINNLLNQAQAVFNIGDYEEAKHLVDQADELLNKNKGPMKKRIPFLL